MMSGRTLGVSKLFNLKTTLIVAGAASLVAGTWYLTAEYKDSKHTAILAEIQKSAMEALVEAQKSAIEKEREYNRIAQEIEVQNEKYRKELARVEDELRGYVNELGGLYDRYATCSSTDVPANTGTTAKPASTPAGAKLSKQLEGLLLSESKRADEAARYAQTCYQWVLRLRESK